MRRLRNWVWTSVRSAGWAPILVFALHVVLSQGMGAYLAYPALDIPMHFAGGVAIAYFVWRSLLAREASALLGELSELGRVLLTFTSVGTATVLWELAEWSADTAGLAHVQLGLGDTILDMTLGIAGGVTFLVLRAGLSSQPQE